MKIFIIPLLIGLLSATVPYSPGHAITALFYCKVSYCANVQSILDWNCSPCGDGAIARSQGTKVFSNSTNGG